jgi:hypothetical protein
VVGVPYPRCPNRKLVAHRRVKPRLGYPKTYLPQELPLLLDEWL